eukprot:9488048-Pyramimonas_sp.AAC.1
MGMRVVHFEALTVEALLLRENMFSIDYHICLGLLRIGFPKGWRLLRIDFRRNIGILKYSDVEMFSRVVEPVRLGGYSYGYTRPSRPSDQSGADRQDRGADRACVDKP